MMGVWMEDESTVTMVSHGINRPNGAKTAPNFLGLGMPAVLSANRLMGVNNSAWRGGTTGNGCGDALGRTDDVVDDDADDAEAVSGLAASGWNGCIGRTTVCTTWGLPPTA